MQKKKKRINDKDLNGKNVRIPFSEWNTIKKYAVENNYKIGGFVATAAIEKIQRDRIK